MKKLLHYFLFFLSINTYSQEYAQDRVIVQLKKDLDKDFRNLNEINCLNFLFEKNIVLEIKTLDISKSKIINGRPLVIVFNQAIDIENIVADLKKTGVFQYVEFDFLAKGSGIMISDKENLKASMQPFAVTPNDQYFFRQWGFHNDGSFTLLSSVAGADVKMKDAWEISTGNQDIAIAIIDSGVKMNHPEFSGRFWTNPNELANNLDDDDNGYIDDRDGWDFVNNDNDPTDDHGHGTNVTGIAMANANNGIGYAGVNWNSKLLVLKTLDQNNSGFNSNIIAAVYYAISRNVNVISMSIGGTGYSSIYHNAIISAYNANIPFLACMMNTNNNVVYYPAAFPEVIAIGSTDPNDYRTSPFFWSASSGSNYGNHIDVVAPGNYMYGLSHTSNTNYNTYWGGTSQATPLVAGIVSLMLSIDSTMNVEQIRSILRNTAQDQVGRISEDTPGFDPYHGAGRVNAFQALLAVQNLNSEKFIKSGGISIYPNPTENIINISSENETKEVMVYEASGKLVNRYKNVSQIDITSLKNGMYFVDVITNYNNKIFKIIKK